MEDFPSNSKFPKQKEDPKKLDPVVTGRVVRRKQPLGRKFKDTFVGGDARAVWAVVFLDVLVPSAKDMIVDAGKEMIERMIYGDSTTPRRRSAARAASNFGHVAYNRMYTPQSPSKHEDRDDRRSRRKPSPLDFDEIILDTRVEAEEVIDRLFDLVAQYDVARVSDLYELLGISGPYTTQKWGWRDIRGAGVTKVRNGYLLDLPVPEPID